MNTRQELLMNMRDAFVALNCRSDELKKRSKCASRINEITSELEKLRDKKPNCMTGIIISIVLGSLSLYVYGSFGLVITGVCIFFTVRSYLKQKKEIESDLEKMTYALHTEVPRLKETINQIDAFLSEYADAFDAQVSFIPSKYRDLHAVAFMYEAVENCRADTLKEAINLYEAYLLDQENKRAMEKAIQMQQEQFAALNQRIQQQKEAMEKMSQTQEKMAYEQEKMSYKQEKIAYDVKEIKNAEYEIEIK
ncbi:MAG: hypothetical protein IKM34_07165 [Clostridia bacterium]|nr:hypothetical protein [Clostridia bacterium]